MTNEFIEENYKTLAEWVYTMAGFVAEGCPLPSETYEDLASEGFSALMEINIEAAENLKAFVTTALRNRMHDFLRRESRHNRCLQLSAFEWGGVQLTDEEPMWRNIPVARDRYNGRRSHLEDYYYI